MSIFNKKSKEEMVYSPVNGKTLLLENVKDEMFANKLLGDGIAVIFEDESVCAPCNGTITMLAETKHAFGITSEIGAEILVHIGLDTVNLGGEGLDALVSVNQKVKAGTPIIKVDREFMNERGIDLTTPVIITNGDNYDWDIEQIEKEIRTSDSLGKILKR